MTWLSQSVDTEEPDLTHVQPRVDASLQLAPIRFLDDPSQQSFQAYLEAQSSSKAEGKAECTEWQLFQLGMTANQARLATNFDTFIVLDHLRGFTPLPHQLETATRVMRELRGRAILADEVGLGKTIEAGLVLKEYMLRGLVRKALILAPASLVLQWSRELHDKFGILAAAQKNEWTWEANDVIVASIDTAKRAPHHDYVINTQWDMLIVDEAHKLKNPRTKNWQMVNQIPNKFTLLLTATPIQNRLQELHTLITLLRPGQLGNSDEFAAEHMESARVPKEVGVLKDRLSRVMIRNRRRDGGTTLPDRHVEVVPLTLSDGERQVYDALQGYLRTEYQSRKARKISMLPLITLQREICSSSYAAMITLDKMLKRASDDATKTSLQTLIHLAESVTTYTKVEKVLEMLEQIDDKCVIFTEYRATQDFLLYMLRKKGVPAVPFRGGFGRGKKDWMKELFAKKMKVLVATESGGEGINLQFCHHMINFDLPWNPMRLEQRIGRIHRLGQTSEVYIYHLSTLNTIEAHMVNLLQEKIRMFEMVIGELDTVLADQKFGNPFEEQILHIAMTSDSEEDLHRKLEEYSDQWMSVVTGKEVNA